MNNYANCLENFKMFLIHKTIKVVANVTTVEVSHPARGSATMNTYTFLTGPLGKARLQSMAQLSNKE